MITSDTQSELYSVHFRFQIMLSRPLLSLSKTGSLCQTSLPGIRWLSSVRVEDGVANITLDSPKTRNALSLEMMTKLINDITTAGNDTSIR